ncbi:MAG TPA: tetratricopeptide repeat protein [Candidatus Polarisedimenticolia bacterium]|nr:tetratricopeptide repeat protein [Candidatus Polarisedimenticolia bacterium]
MTARRLLRLGLLAALLMLPVSIRAQARLASTPETLFRQGNEAYSKGDFATAQKAYEEILRRGVHDSRVFYNLANACFRRNEIGKAILFYEKTLKIEPSDADARENLRFVRLRVRDRTPPDSAPFLIAQLERGKNLLSLEQVTRVFLGLYFAAMAIAAVWILGRPRRWAMVAGALAGAVLILAVFFGGWTAWQARDRVARDDAVVLSEKLEVYSGPGRENTLLASVHEGAMVKIHARRGEWTQVTLPDGRAGWLQGEGLGVI